MSNPTQLSALTQTFSVTAGQKLSIYAIDDDAQVTIRSNMEPFVSKSAIAHGTRPRDITLSETCYGKMTSSPMGHNTCMTIRLPRNIASYREFLMQVDMLYSLACESGFFNPPVDPNADDRHDQ